MTAASRSDSPLWLLVGLTRAEVQAWTQMLKLNGCAVVATDGLRTTRALLREKPARRFVGAIVEEHLPNGSGLEVRGLLSELQPELPVVLISAWPNFDRALRAARSGHVVLPAPRTRAERHRLISFVNDARPGVRVETASHASARGRRRRNASDKLVLDGSCLTTPTGVIWLTAVQQRLLDALSRRSREKYVPPSELARRTFGRVDGAAGALVRRHISLLRRALGSYGWVIESRPGHGYRLAAVVRLA